MITHFELGNFKAFGDIQRIPLTDINLIFGANSAGKSTLMQAFAYLDEAFRTKSWDVHKTRLGGEYMDLGGLKNIVHKHDTERIIHLGVTLDRYQIVSTHFLRKAIDHERQIQESIEKTLKALNSPDIYFDTTYTIRFGIHPTSKDALEYLELVEEESTLVGASDIDFHLPKYRTVFKIKREGTDFRIEDINVDTLFFHKLDSIPYNNGYGYSEGNRQLQLTEAIPDPSLARDLFIGQLMMTDDDYPFFGFFLPDQIDLSESEEGNQPVEDLLPDWYISNLNTELNCLAGFIGIGFEHHDGDYPFVKSTNLSKQLTSTNHIGYVRTTPSRHLTLQEAYGTVYESLLSNENLIAEINASFDQIGIGLHVVRKTWSLKDSTDRREITTLELHDIRRDTNVSFRDVGQGVMQILPILASIHSWPFELYYNPPPRYIFIEQPELHIHPAAQVGLGRVLAQRFSPKNASSPYKLKPTKHYIIETHSEHLIKALQVEVARYASTKGKEGLNPNKVAIHYVVWDESNSQSVIRTLRLDENGSFTEPWPEDFFGLSGDLSIERLRLMNQN